MDVDLLLVDSGDVHDGNFPGLFHYLGIYSRVLQALAFRMAILPAVWMVTMSDLYSHFMCLC